MVIYTRSWIKNRKTYGAIHVKKITRRMLEILVVVLPLRIAASLPFGGFVPAGRQAASRQSGPCDHGPRVEVPDPGNEALDGIGFELPAAA